MKPRREAWAEATAPDLKGVVFRYGDGLLCGELAEYRLEQANVRMNQRLDY